MTTPSNPHFEVELVKGGTALCDIADAELVRQYRWYLSTHKDRRYALTWLKGESISMHRLLLPGVAEVDHRNGDGLDNRRNNLRACTRSQNMANASYRRGVSGYRGVTRYRRRWRAQITVNRKCHHVGTYDTPEEAARAYDARALEAFGEFASLNFPQS